MPPKKKNDDLKPRMLPDGSLKLTIPSFNKTRGERVARLKNVPFDVKLSVGADKHSVEAHKEVLKAEIPYFSAMFSGSFQESTKEAIDLDLPTIETDGAIRKLVDLFYKGFLTVTTQDAQDMFIVCDIWSLDSVKRNCVDFMLQKLDCFNCFELLCLGEMYSIKEMVDICNDLISREFQIISRLDSFVDVPAESLVSLVKRDDLNLGHPGEDVMLEAVTRWLKHDWPHRQQHLDDIMPHIRYSRCSEAVRDGFINLKPETIKKVVERLIGPYTLNGNWIPHEVETKRRRKENIMVFCGSSHTRVGPVTPKLKTVELFNVETKTTKCVDLPEAPSCGQAFNLMGRVIYLAVFVCTDPNTRKQKMASSVYTFRPEQPNPHNMYRTSPEVFTEEAQHCIMKCLFAKGCVAYCPVRNCIYTVTMKNVDRIKVTCSNGEIKCDYEKALPKLTSVVKEGHSRTGMQCVCHRGRLYVIGGSWGPEYDRMVGKETFELSKDETSWKKCFSDMSKTRTDFGVASNGYEIVVTGGFGGYFSEGLDHDEQEPFKRLRDCEMLRPDDTMWCNYCALRQYKTFHSMVVANGRFYVLGGKTYSSQKLNDEMELAGQWIPGGARIVSSLIETFDSGWQRFGKMSKGRCMFSAVAV